MSTKLSDEEILDLAREHDAIQRSPEGCEYPGIVLEFARALLERNRRLWQLVLEERAACTTQGESHVD